MHKYNFIINPVAGKVDSSGIIKRLRSLSADLSDVNLYFTERPKHATDITSNILKENFDRVAIIAVGGDGTLNEVVNGFDKNSKAVLGVLPFGSGNDVCRFLYRRKKNFVDVVLNKNLSKVVEFDVGAIELTDENGEVHTKKFLNAIGIGFDAYVAHLNQNEKRLTGIPSYLLAVTKALKKLTGIEMNIKLDDKSISGDYLITTVGNGKTSGGGFYLNPGADPTDGILNITTIETTSRMKIVRNLPLALLNKLQKVDIAKFYKGRKINMELNKPFFVHSDGEIISQSAVKLDVSLSHKIKMVVEK